MKKKRKYIYLEKCLIIRILQIYIFSFYDFLFFISLSKTKSTVVRKLKDMEGNLTGEEELQVSESELAPNLQAMSVWLYHHDEDWRKVERKQDEDADIPTDIDHGISIDSWIKDKLK